MPWVQGAVDTFGKIDVVVNNAGNPARRELSQDEPTRTGIRFIKVPFTGSY